MIKNVEQLVEVMAREICKEMGLDPDAMVSSSGQPAWKYKKQHVTRALLAAQAEGAEMVPSEATREMCNAAVDATNAGTGMSWRNLSPQGLFRGGHVAMLTANPLRIKDAP